MKLEHVVARAMAGLRLQRGWTQADLAWRMSQMGLKWTPNRVTQLETLRRPVSLYEVAALAWAFEVPVVELLAGDDQVEAPDGQMIVPLAQIRAAIAGDTSRQEAGRRLVRDVQYRDEIRRLAKALDLQPDDLEQIADEMYGRTFVDEREARLGDISGLSKESLRTKRGHVTRALMEEVREHLKRRDADG